MEANEQTRIARTEALFRGVNERIAVSAERFGSDDASFVCECDDPACTHRIRVTLEEYDEVRSDGAQFLVDEEHVNHQVERIVERRRCYALVEKVKPLVRRTVLRLDPRTAQNA
jgi:queuine/archaeosine tRNA-ribosyltransferase